MSMETFRVTMRSWAPVDLGNLTSDGFEHLLAGAGVTKPFTWQQDDVGDITVTFWHEAADAQRCQGAAERLANEIGLGNWEVSVEQGEPPT
jgi:hypothetical protein